MAVSLDSIAILMAVILRGVLGVDKSFGVDKNGKCRGEVLNMLLYEEI